VLLGDLGETVHHFHNLLGGAQNLLAVLRNEVVVVAIADKALVLYLAQLLSIQGSWKNVGLVGFALKEFYLDLRVRQGCWVPAA